MNEVGLSVSPFLTTHVHSEWASNLPREQSVVFMFTYMSLKKILPAGQSCVMPIRRAAATPSQEKPPSAAAGEKG